MFKERKFSKFKNYKQDFCNTVINIECCSFYKGYVIVLVSVALTVFPFSSISPRLAATSPSRLCPHIDVYVYENVKKLKSKKPHHTQLGFDKDYVPINPDLCNPADRCSILTKP